MRSCIPSTVSVYRLAWLRVSDESVDLARHGTEEGVLIHEAHSREIEAVIGVEHAVVLGRPARCTPGRRREVGCKKCREV